MMRLYRLYHDKGEPEVEAFSHCQLDRNGGRGEKYYSF